MPTVAASSAGRALLTNTLTVSHTVPAGTNRYLIVLGNVSSSMTGLGCTYGGVALTKTNDIDCAAGASGPGRLVVFELANPTVGTANVVLAGAAGSFTLCASVLTLTSCRYLTTLTTAEGSSTTASVTVGSRSGDLVLDVCGSGGTASVNFTAGAGQTGITEQDGLTGTSRRLATSSEAGATSVVMSWTLAPTAAWISGGLSASDTVSAAVRLSQAVIETLTLLVAPARVTQSVIEVLTPVALVADVVDVSPPIYVPWFEWWLDGGTISSGPVGRAVDDPSSYYGGWKGEDVLSFGTVSRAQSDVQGQYRAPTFAVTLNDPARTYRTLLSTQTVKGRTGLVRLIDHARRALGETPAIVVRGLAQSPKYTRALTLQVEFDDPVSREFGGAGFAPQIPRRTISRRIFTGLAETHEALNRPAPIIYGDFSTPLDAVGPIPAIPLDTEEIADAVLPGTYGRLLIAGHACANVSTTIYVNGEDYSTVGPAHGAILIPGSARWNLVPSLASATYRDIGGERWTIMYIKTTNGWWKDARDGKVQITLLVQGIEDSVTGDGTGTLIASVYHQLRHLLTNYIFGHQTTTPIAAPLWPDGDPQLASASFDACHTLAEARLSGGYPAAAYLQEPWRPSDLLAAFCRCGDCAIGWTRDWQLALAMFDKSATAVARFAPSGSDLVLSESVEIVPDDSQHWNQLVYAWGERTVHSGMTADLAHVRDASSIAAYGLTLPSPTFDFPFLRSATVAQNNAEHRLRRHTHPPNRVTLTTDLGGLDLELGEVLALTDKAGRGSSGWTSHQLVVDGIAIDLDTLKTSVALTDHDQVPAALVLTTAVTSLTSAAGLATATTSTPHGYATGDVITIAGATPAAYTGTVRVTVTGASTFTYAVTGSPASPATGTITASTSDLGQTMSPDEYVKVNDRKTKTGKVAVGHIERNLGGDADVGVLTASYVDFLKRHTATINREQVGDRTLIFRSWRKTAHAGTSVRTRLVVAGTSTVIAEGTATTSLTFEKEDVEIDPTDWQPEEVDYEGQLDGNNATNHIFAYGKIIARS